MEELYYYIPNNSGTTNATQQISHIQQPYQHQQLQQVQPQLVAYYPSTNYIIPQQELQQQNQRNSQPHPQLYSYPQTQVMYTNQSVNPRYTTVCGQIVTQQPNTTTNSTSRNIYQEIPNQLNITNNQNNLPTQFNNDINVSPTSVTQTNLSNIKLPPLSSLVSQIKSTTQSCPDISTLASQSTSPMTTTNVNNIRGFTSATSISSASSTNKTNNSTNNHRNSIPYILTFASKNEDNQNLSNNNNLHSVTNHNQSIQLPISNYQIRQITPPILTISPKQKNQKINKMLITNRNSNENLTNLIKRNNDITIIEPIKINHTTINDMKLGSINNNNHNKNNNGKVPSQQRKQCPICGKICSRPSTLKTHFLIHTGDNPFKCSWVGCKKSFNVKSNMLRHLKSHQRKLEKLAKKQADLLNKEKLKQSDESNNKNYKKK